MTTTHYSARECLLVTAIVVAALGVRVLHVLSVVGYEQEQVVPGLDRWLQMEIARAVADGDWLGGPLAPYESSPTYAVGLGMLYQLSGRDWIGPLLTQAVIGALVPVFLWAAGRRLAGAGVGVLAAGLAALYGPAIFHEGLLLKFSLIPAAGSALLWATAGAAYGRRPWTYAFAAGAAVAALVNLRLNAVLVLPVVAVWIAWAHRPRTAAVAILSLGAGLCAVAAPLAFRRTVAAEHGRAGSLWGIHFYIGCYPEGSGGYTVVPGIRDSVFGHVDDARAHAEQGLGVSLTPGEVSRYWFWQGIAQIRRHPSAYLTLQGRKLRRLLAPDEDDVMGDGYAGYAGHSPVLRASLSFGAIAPLALFGALLACARRSRVCWCVAVVTVHALSLLVFFVTGRYRLVVVPPLLVCAAFGLMALRDLERQRGLLAVALGIAGLLLTAVFVTGARRADVGQLAIVLGLGLLVSLGLTTRGDDAPSGSGP